MKNDDDSWNNDSKKKQTIYFNPKLRNSESIENIHPHQIDNEDIEESGELKVERCY